MQIATYIDESGASHAAVAVDGWLVPAAKVATVLGVECAVGDPPCCRALLELGADTTARLAEAAATLVANGVDAGQLAESGMIELDDAKLAPPVRNPEKILCAGLNYRDHAEEAGMAVPDVVPVFCKFINALVGQGEPVIHPANTEMLDWEGELAVVIGATCKNVEPGHALACVAGVTVMNDVTARDLQFSTSQWFAGKGLDTFAPCGPTIVSLEEVGSLDRLRLVTRHNGDVVQDTTTAQMVVRVPELISYLSTLVTLRPGDIIATGTGAGIGFLMEPKRFMLPGDTVSVEIENVGTLTNTIADAQ
jgi:2-keto-4-pentenoate hydratase/2-oxohepta-3-ene-1,7-dioic acid hydratase in catechol pathway